MGIHDQGKCLYLQTLTSGQLRPYKDSDLEQNPLTSPSILEIGFAHELELLELHPLSPSKIAEQSSDVFSVEPATFVQFRDLRLCQNAVLYKEDVFPAGSPEWPAKTNIQLL